MKGHSAITFFKAKGERTSTAIVQREKASVTGWMRSLSPLAIMKLPDHMAVAVIAKRMPTDVWLLKKFFKWCLFYLVKYQLM